MSFNSEEIAYIRSQKLARVATVAADGQPDVVPVGFTFDGAHFLVGGIDPTNTRRAHNVRAGNEKVALVIDDVVTEHGWGPRFLRVYGTAELVDRDGKQILRITPVTSWSLNLAGTWSPADGGRPPFHRTEHVSGA